MKKFFMILLLGIFMISFTSALEFDNVRYYNETTRTYEIVNWLGLGETLAEIKLNTPLVLVVPRGYQKVAEFELYNFKKDYDDAFKDLNFYQANNLSKEISRTFDYKYLDYETISVSDYETSCTNKTNENNTVYQDCKQEEVGWHWEDKEIWIKFNDPNELPSTKESFTIGIFTNVLRDDYVEWIPTFFGEELTEWAIWTESLNTGLVSYYACEDDLATTNAIDSIDTSNGTASTITSDLSVVGKVNDAFEFVRSNLESVNLNFVPDTTSDFSWVGWMKTNGGGAGSDFILSSQGTATSGVAFIIVSNKLFVAAGKAPSERALGSSTTTINDNAWHFLALVYNGTHGRIYVDGGGAEVDSAWAPYTSGAVNLYMSRRGTDNTLQLDGVIDEVGIWNRTLSDAEILQLYNNGTGITWTDDFGVTVQLNSPVNDFNSSSNEITFNTTVNSRSTSVVNVSLLIDGAINETNTSGVVGNYIFQKNLSDGSHNWSITSTDNESNIAESETRNLTVDTTLPQITIESPTGTLSFNTIGLNETLNVTFTDIRLDACWFDYNDTNITLDGCLTGVKNLTEFILEQDNLNMTIYANDTFGNENSAFISWNYNLTEISQIYPASSVESATETYTANLSYNSTNFGVITGILTLNGTQYLGTRTGTGDDAVFSVDAIMPSITEETNFTAYWTVSLTDVAGTINYNLTSNNVTVEQVNLSLCDVTNNVAFWNFTVYNETNLIEINSTLGVTFTIKVQGSSEENTFSFSDTTGGNSQFDFCISPGAQNYVASANIKLTKVGYVDKFYNYQEISLNNLTREDSLYMMATADSTSFIVHVVYVDSTDINGAEVNVQRYYQGTNQWLTTEILTTNYIGEAVGHLLSEDADYRFNVSLGGINIHTSSSTKITCTIAPCTVTLTVPITVPSGVEEVENLESTLTYSDVTNTFTYTYSDTSGDFSSARLYVNLIWPSNATSIVACNETKTSSSGVIICDISSQLNGTYRASGYITRTGDEFLDKRIDATIGTNIYNAMGLDGVLWGFFVLMAIIMIGISRPSLAIIFGTAGLIILSFLEIINIGALSIIAVSAIAIILLMRVDKE